MLINCIKIPLSSRENIPLWTKLFQSSGLEKFGNPFNAVIIVLSNLVECFTFNHGYKNCP